MRHNIITFIIISFVAIACSKEEAKEAANNIVNEQAKVTAEVDGTAVQFAASRYTFEQLTSSLTLVATATNGQSINISTFVSGKGVSFTKEEGVSFTHGVNTTDLRNTTNGAFTVSVWDTTNNTISGAFNFAYLHEGDTVVIDNGVFAEVKKQ